MSRTKMTALALMLSELSSLYGLSFGREFAIPFDGYFYPCLLSCFRAEARHNNIFYDAGIGIIVLGVSFYRVLCLTVALGPRV